VNKVTFYEAQGFVDYVKRHSQALESGPFEIFQTVDVKRQYLYGQCHGRNDVEVISDTYQAYVKVLGEVIAAVYSTKPGAPRGWEHASDKRLMRAETRKTEAVDILVSLGVKPAALAPLKKVALGELQQLIDNSSEDETTVIDDKRLISKRKKNQLVFPTNGQDGIDETMLTLTRDGSRIQYNFSVDWAKEWAAREEDAQNIIHKAGFIIYKGNF